MITRITDGLNKVKDVYHVFYYALIVAGLFHAFFFLLFSWLDIAVLSTLNIISCLIYAICAYLFIRPSRSEDYRLVATLAYIEIVAHAYIVSYYIGLDSGFHYYILSLTVVPLVNANILLLSNLLRLAVLAAVYILLFVWLHEAQPSIELDKTVLLIMRSGNIAVLTALIGFISFRTLEAVLIEKAALFDLARTDKLTGLYNRHGFMDIVKQEVSGDEVKSIDALSILVLDVDLFKEVNDQYGHQCGDYVLAKLAQVMRASLRKHEMIARWGGDEFIVLLPNTDKKELTVLAERLRKEVEQTKFDYQQHVISISVTIGGTTYQPGDSFESLTSRADKALYKGKDSGGNAFNTEYA